MIILAVLLIPLVSALAVHLVKKDNFSRSMPVIAGALNAALCGLMVTDAPVLQIAGTLTLAVDMEGLLLLAITDILFLLASLHLYSWQVLDKAGSAGHQGMKYSSFAALLLLFYFTMTLTAVAQDFGMLWVAVEATTLASAPLINFHRSKGSLEAMWKYLLICSIGIGIALFGTMLLAASLPDPHAGLGFATVRAALRSCDVTWFKLGFVLCFAGYALKMGLAPFHTWLPDAHSEAPAPVSALLSGSLLNCALLAVWRLYRVIPESLTDFACGYFKFLGFFSLAVAAFFIINQKDFKRMLAYSSVEHMGLIILFIAYDRINSGMLHIFAHSLAKMSLFLIAGNILLSYGTRSIDQVRGLFDKLPKNAALWLFGMLIICGTPPSPLFFTELALVKAAGLFEGSVILLLLLVIFCGMSARMLQMLSPAGKRMEVDREVDSLARIPAEALAMTALTGIVIGVVWMMKG